MRYSTALSVYFPYYIVYATLKMPLSFILFDLLHFDSAVEKYIILIT